eukprot:scpid2635/ scgid28349/ Protein unc-80; Uncoordinated protein 80
MALTIVQQHLWSQLSFLLGHSPVREDWDGACLHLARDILRHNDPDCPESERCPVADDHYDLLVSVCLPYVIQACKAVIEQRAVTEQFSEPESQILATLHWLLLNDTTPFSTQGNLVSRKPILDYSVVELFVSSLVPILGNLDSEDFGPSTNKPWKDLWGPLVAGVPPDVTLLVQPCAVLGSGGRLVPPEQCAVWLDIAALLSLSWSDWSDQARAWSLTYLRNRVSTLCYAKGNVPRGFQMSMSVHMHASTTSTSSFPFAGPVSLDNFLDENVLHLESVVDTIVSMHVPEEVDEEVQFASLQLLQTAIELMCKQIHDETESLLTNSASDESLVLKDGKLLSPQTEALFHKILSALLEVTVRCGCYQKNCREGLKGLKGANFHHQIRSLFTAMCHIDSQAMRLHLNTFAEVSPIEKTLFCLHCLLGVCSRSKPAQDQMAESSAKETQAQSGTGDKSSKSPNSSIKQRYNGTGSLRKHLHNLLPDSASGAGEFIMNLASRPIRNISSLKDRLISEYRDKDSGVPTEKRLKHANAIDISKSNDSIGSVDTRRRRLRKSKSLALRFNKDKLMSGDWFETSRSKLIRSHSAEQPTGPPSIKFNVAKLDGFILKHTLRPLVAQLGRVDMMAPVNEMTAKEACRLVAFANCNHDKVLRSVILHCLLSTRPREPSKPQASAAKRSSKTSSGSQHSPFGRSSSASVAVSSYCIGQKPANVPPAVPEEAAAEPPKKSDLVAGRTVTLVKGASVEAVPALSSCVEIKDMSEYQHLGSNRNRSFTLPGKSLVLDDFEGRERSQTSRFRNFIPDSIWWKGNKTESSGSGGSSGRDSIQTESAFSTSAPVTPKPSHTQQHNKIPILTRENTDENSSNKRNEISDSSNAQSYLSNINSDQMHTGLVSLAALLQCSESGSLPDANLIAATLDLNCPIVARAAFLIECTLLVRDCRERRYPAWMVMENQPFDAAVHNFWLWGQALANKLQEIFEKHEDSRRSVAVTVQDVDGPVCLNPTPQLMPKTPQATYQLFPIACQLLFEISAYLREVSNGTSSGIARGASSCNIARAPVTQDSMRTFNNQDAARTPVSQDSARSFHSSRISRTEHHRAAVAPKAQFAMVAAAAAAAAVHQGSVRRRSGGPVPSRLSTSDAAAMSQVDVRAKSPCLSEDSHASMPCSTCGPTISVETAGTSLHTSAVVGEMHEDYTAPTMALEVASGHGASDLLLAPPLRAQTVRTPSMSSAFSSVSTSSAVSAVSGSSGVSGNSTDSEPLSVSASNSAARMTKLRSQLPARRGLKIRHDLSPASTSTVRLGADFTHTVRRKENHSRRSSVHQLEDPYGVPKNLLQSQDCDCFPWLDIVSKMLIKACVSSGSCQGHCNQKECISLVYKEATALLQAVGHVYNHDSDSVVPAQQWLPKRSQSNSSIRKHLEERLAESGSSSAGMGLDSTFLMDLDPMKKLPKPNGRRRSNTMQNTQANLMIVNTTVPSISSVERERDQVRIDYITESTENLIGVSHRVLLSSASVITRRHFDRIVPALWDQTLASNREMAVSAGCLFLLAGIRSPEKVKLQMRSAMKANDPQERVDALKRFMFLWNCRNQVWARADQTAPRNYKVTNTHIAISLPQPLIGIATLPLAYPPWSAAPDAPMDENSNLMGMESEAESGLKSTQSHRFNLKGTIELIGNSATAEAEDSKSGQSGKHATDCDCKVCEHVRERHREETHLTEINLAHEASIDQMLDKASSSLGPTSSFPLSADEYNTNRRNMLFPPSISASSLQIVSLLQDTAAGTSVGKMVSDIAREVIVHCTTDEPALFFRPFMERATSIKECNRCLDILRILISHISPLPAQCSHFLLNLLLAVVIHHSKQRTDSKAQDVISKALSILWIVVYSCRGVDMKLLKERLKKEYCDTDVLTTSRLTTVKNVVVLLPEGHFLSKVNVPVTSETTFGTILGEALSKIGQMDDGSFCLVEAKANAALVSTHFVGDHFSRRREHREDLTLRLETMRPDRCMQMESLAFGYKTGEISRVLFASSVMSMAEVTRNRISHKAVEFLHHELSNQKAFPRRAVDSDFDLFYFLEDRAGLFGCDKLHKRVWVRFVSILFDGLPSTFEWGPEASLFLSVLNGAVSLHSDDNALLRHTCATYINASRKFVHLFPLHGYEPILAALLTCYSSSKESSLVRKSVEYTCRQFYNRHDVGFILQLLSSAAHQMLTPNMPYFMKKKKAPPQVSPQSVVSLLQSMTVTNPEDPLCIGDLIAMLQSKGHHTDPITVTHVGAHHTDGANGENLTAAEKTMGSTNASHWEYHQQDARTISANPPVAVPLFTSSQRFAQTGRIGLAELGRVDVPFSLVEVLRIIVSVIAFESDSLRGAEMLYVLRQIMPFVLKFKQVARSSSLILTVMRALVHGCESLSRYTSLRPVPEKNLRRTSTFDRSRPHTHSSNAPRASQSMPEEDAHSNNAGISDRAEKPGQMSSKSLSVRFAEFREPRDCLLHIIADYVTSDASVISSMNTSSVQTLLKVTASLIKTASNNHDADALDGIGLQRFFTDVLPVMDWKSSKLQPLLVRLLDRVIKLLQRVESSAVRWNGLGHICQGLYLVVQAQPFIARLPSLLRTMEELIRFVLNLSNISNQMQTSGPTGTLFYRMRTCCNLRVPITGYTPKPPSKNASTPNMDARDFSTAVDKVITPSMAFYEIVIQLLSAQMSVMGSEFSLEYICGPLDQFVTVKPLNCHLLCTLLLPLCIRMGSGQSDAPKVLQRDADYALDCILTCLSAFSNMQSLNNPTAAGSAGQGAQQQMKTSANINPVQSFVSLGRRDSSVSGTMGMESAAPMMPMSSVMQGHEGFRLKTIAYHGLKIVSVCFERQLSSRYHLIAHHLQFTSVSKSCLDFMEFVLTSHSPLEVILRPVIVQQMQECKLNGTFPDEIARIQQLVEVGDHLPTPRSTLLLQLARELPELLKVEPAPAALPSSNKSSECSRDEFAALPSRPPASTLGGALISVASSPIGLISSRGNRRRSASDSSYLYSQWSTRSNHKLKNKKSITRPLL